MKTLAKVHPELIAEWSDKNGELKPEDVSYGSNRKVWWLSKCGHTWQASVKNRGNGSGCPYCSGNRVLYGVNDLESKYSEIAAEWSERNYPMKPAEVTACANKKVWWKCSHCGYEWQARVADRTEGHGCPACAGSVIYAGYNDLATRYPDLAAEWGEENEGSPSIYSPRSREKAWWKCAICGYKWESAISTRINNRDCPCCRAVKRAEQRVWEKADKTGFMLNTLQQLSEERGLKTVYNEESRIGIPIAIYFPERQAAIEFTDAKQNWGPRRRWENAKNWLCFNAGIRMIRIIAPGAKAYRNCECISRQNNGQTEAYNAVKEAVDAI